MLPPCDPLRQIFLAAFDRPSCKSGFEDEHTPVARERTVGQTVEDAVGQTRDEKVGERVGETQEISSPCQEGTGTWSPEESKVFGDENQLKPK